MSDRIDCIVVVLEHDVRDDDATATCDAIRQIRGVLSVVPHVADIMGELSGEMRERRRWLDGIRDIVDGAS